MPGARPRVLRLAGRTWSLPPHSDWPFAVKMGFLPGLGILAMIAIAYVAVGTINAQAGLIHSVVDEDLAGAIRLQQAAMHLREVDAGLYRTLTLQAAHAPDHPVAREIAALLATMRHLIAELAAYRDRLGPGATRAQLDRVLADLETYRGGVDVVGSMVELDFASAVEFVRPFDGATRSILGALSHLADEAVNAARARAAASTRAGEQARNWFAAVAVVVSCLLLILVVLMTRAMVRSVERIARATVQVARGDRLVNVAALVRRDELGAIVESLEAFQDNVARVAFLAHHDALTGLPNRNLFAERLNSALMQLERGQQFALICLDLDRFKPVNDTLGHPVGDAVLRGVADRLCGCIRQGDTAARLGGDEFAIILLGVRDSPGASLVAERLIGLLNEPFDIDGHQVNIGCSLGIAMAPVDGAHATGLLKNADTALYRAKADGRNTYRFFEAAMDAHLQFQRALEIELRRALAEQEFELHYQPVIEVATMQVAGFEALARWRHPERGMISPGDFIPVAEETGLIVALGEWVLVQACHDAMTWPEAVKVAVNLSAMQFKDNHLLQVVLRALETSGLAPGRLELEITESILLHNSAATLEVLTALRARGVRIAMDDFGTGYSSLSYLRSFPFDKIKIDQSFVRDLSDKEESVAIVRAVTGLGGSLGVTTTAEGVETRKQFDRLVSEGCTEVQGYLFGRPQPASQVPITLAQFQRPHAGTI